MKKFKANIYSQLGASNHVIAERQKDDFYSTDPHAVECLLETLEKLNIEIPGTIIEPSVGMGHIADKFKNIGKKVIGYDIVHRGYEGTILQDFLTLERLETSPKMFVENPPYKLALKFVEKSLNFCSEGEYVCAFLKIQFLESQSRYEFFDEYPPEYVVIFSKRISCHKDGIDQKDSSAMCFAWFIWKKGYKGFPKITWTNFDKPSKKVMH